MLSFELDVEDASYLRHLIIVLFGLHEGSVWLQRLTAGDRVAELTRNVEPVLIYQHDSLVIEPLHTLSVLPKTVLD